MWVDMVKSEVKGLKVAREIGEGGGQRDRQEQRPETSARVKTRETVSFLLCSLLFFLKKGIENRLVGSFPLFFLNRLKTY